MSTLLDDIIGLGEESAFGTPVTVDRWYPHMDDDDSQWDPRVKQGMGLHGGSGRISPLAARAQKTAGQGVITLKAELESKQGGELLRAALGTSSVEAVSGDPGGAFMLFHPGIAGTYLPCYTIQHVKVRNDGTDFVETYSGCTPSKAKIEQPEDDYLTIEVEFDALTHTTGTAKASQSYASGSLIYDSYRVASTVFGGSITPPTTTAFATGGTSITAFREYSIEIDHSIDDADWILGTTRGRPIAGIPKIKFSGKANFDAATLPEALRAGSAVGFYATYSTLVTNELDTGVSGGFQVCIPSMILSKELPKVKAGDRRTISVNADVKNNGTAEDIYVAYRTVDSAL